MIEDQPPPQPNNRPAIADLVVADMVERKRIGIERYGTPLQAHNGRDSLVDAYQEALDFVMYLRQAIEERPRIPGLEPGVSYNEQERRELLAFVQNFAEDDPRAFDVYYAKAKQLAEKYSGLPF